MELQNLRWFVRPGQLTGPVLMVHWPHAAQADTWTELFPSGGPPAARFKFDAAWSDAADGFYVFGGSNGNRNGGPGP